MNQRNRMILLETQMRAGSHYVCYGLQQAFGATLLWPDKNGTLESMPQEQLKKGLYTKDYVKAPQRTDLTVVFKHYYHQLNTPLCGGGETPHIAQIGFPLDSFYSDGIVFSDGQYDAGPSGNRPHARSYVFRFGSEEWKFLEPYMARNADWLESLHAKAPDLILRYEDFFIDFNATVSRIEALVGDRVGPFPQPKQNAGRMYWTEDYRRLDRLALVRLWEIFEKSIRQFYPERVRSITEALRP
jgi:hypothetical protein